MKYTLYNRLGSGGFVVEAMFALADIGFDYEPIQSKPSRPLGASIDHLNAWGQLPVLVLPDGRKMTEVAAIIAYLAQVEERCRMGPHLWVDDLAAFLRWSVFLSVNVYEAVLRRIYSDRYFVGLGEVVAEGVDMPGIDFGATMTASIRKSGRNHAHKALRHIESEIAAERFLLGSRLSPCDLYLAMLYAWHNRQPDLPKCAEITARVATHAIVNPIWQRNFGDRLDEKWHEGGPLWQ
ncbi:MAG: glutathione S-transferase family protein [Pseudomonadota bacterium]